MTHQMSRLDAISSRSEKDRKEYVKRIPGHMRSFSVATTDKRPLTDRTRKIKDPISGNIRRVPMTYVPKKGKNKGKEIPCKKRIHVLIHKITIVDEHGTDFLFVLSRKGITIHGIKMRARDKWDSENPHPGIPWESPCEDWMEKDPETGENVLCRPWKRLNYPTMYREEFLVFLQGMIHPDDVASFLPFLK